MLCFAGIVLNTCLVMQQKRKCTDMIPPSTPCRKDTRCFCLQHRQNYEPFE